MLELSVTLNQDIGTECDDLDDRQLSLYWVKAATSHRGAQGLEWSPD